MNDLEWLHIVAHIPPAKSGGRPREQEMREVVNAMFYVLRSGCAWRMLPKDYPCWQTVYTYFSNWRKNGTIEELHHVLRDQVRAKAGKENEPTAGIIDSQSVKTVEQVGISGYDAGKKIKGRKRHFLVDTLGLLLAVVVHSAKLQDRDGVKLLLFKIRHTFPKLKIVWADGGYAGKLEDWVKRFFNWTLDIVRKREDAKGFELLPKRWIVERTFAWIGRYRRLSKDYECSVKTSEAMIYLAMIRLMLKRLEFT